MNLQYEIYTLNLLPYYYNNNYYHILSINKKPKGPLIDFVKLINIKNPSSKINKFNESTCLYCIKNNLLNSTNNNIDPLLINASDLGIDCSLSGEQYESMLVSIQDVSFDSVDEFGNWTVSDPSGSTMIDDYYFDGTFPTINAGDSYDCVTGVVSYSYSEFKIYPRNIDDFSCYGAAACDSADGDANEDGFTDILDLVGIIGTIVSQDGFTDYELCVSDVNGDGEVNVLDIVVIVNLIIS